MAEREGNRRPYGKGRTAPGSQSAVKFCTTCAEVRPLSAFSRNHMSKDGHAWKCKTCSSAYHRLYRAANVESLNAGKRRWACDNPAKAKASRRKWERANPGTGKALRLEWRKANRAKCRARVSLWRARKRGAFVGDRKTYIAFVEWARTAKAVRCYWCKKPTSRRGRHLDHIIALSRGGSDSIGNLCVSCPNCNQRKNAQMPEAFSGQSELSF